MSRIISATSAGIEFELQLIPNAFNELDVHFAPIKVAVEIQEMNFQQRRAVINRGPSAKTSHGRISTPVDAGCDRVNSVSEPVCRLKRDIRRRHAKRAPQPLARNHLARNRIVAAESARRRGEIAVLDGLADGARGESPCFVLHLLNNLDPKAELCSGFGERGRGTGPALTKMEVPSDDHRARSEPLN